MADPTKDDIRGALYEELRIWMVSPWSKRGDVEDFEGCFANVWAIVSDQQAAVALAGAPQPTVLWSGRDAMYQAAAALLAAVDGQALDAYHNDVSVLTTTAMQVLYDLTEFVTGVRQGLGVVIEDTETPACSCKRVDFSGGIQRDLVCPVHGGTAATPRREATPEDYKRLMAARCACTLVTYTQHGETGASLRAAGWRVIAERPARPGWTCPSRPRDDHGVDRMPRTLWEAS